MVLSTKTVISAIGTFLMASAIIWVACSPRFAVQQTSYASAVHNRSELFVGIEQVTTTWQGNNWSAFLFPILGNYPEKSRVDYIVYHMKDEALTRFSFRNSPSSNLVMYRGEVFLQRYDKINADFTFRRWSGKEFIDIDQETHDQLNQVLWGKSWRTFTDYAGWNYISSNELSATARDKSVVHITIKDMKYELQMREAPYGAHTAWQQLILKGPKLPGGKLQLSYSDKITMTMVSESVFQAYRNE